MLEIAGGIVLGGLVLAFLLKTRAGWYVLVGFPVAVGVGVLLSLFAMADLSDAKPERMLAWFIAISVLALACGWWVPRTIVYYRSTSDARNEKSESDWEAFKWSVNESFIEVYAGIISITFFSALVVGPFVWAYSPSPVAKWGEGGTVISWGLVALFVGAWLYGKLNDKRQQKHFLKEQAIRAAKDREEQVADPEGYDRRKAFLAMLEEDYRATKRL